jgi:hypothetical protein
MIICGSNCQTFLYRIQALKRKVEDKKSLAQKNSTGKCRAETPFLLAKDISESIAKKRRKSTT